MNDTSGNSGKGTRDGRGPSGLPEPGPAPSTAELRRRATSYFDREMGPAETDEFKARLLADDRALREFEMTRRAIEHLRTGRPSPDLTRSILDEVERRRRLLGVHRHARRRRIFNIASAAGAIAMAVLVFFGVDSVLPGPGGPPTAARGPGPMGPLVAVPGVADRDAPADGALALELHGPVDASRGLRWDISASPMLVGAPTEIARGSLPLESSSWAPLGTSGVWPTLFPNASISRPPASALLVEALKVDEPGKAASVPVKPAAPREDAKPGEDAKPDKQKSKDQPGPASQPKPPAPR